MGVIVIGSIPSEGLPLMRMQVEVEGHFDAGMARRTLEALQACRDAGCVRLTFRRTRSVQHDALMLLVEGLRRLPVPPLQCEGLGLQERILLRLLGHDPVSLEALPLHAVGNA